MSWIYTYRMRRLPAVVVALAAAIALRPAALFAQGCAMCRTALGGPNDPLGVGMNTSILFMMAMPFVMVGSVGAWITYMYWRGGRDERSNAHSLVPRGEELS